MFSHFYELIVVLVLALIFFGPEKLPEIAHSAGKVIGELRAAMDSALQPDQHIQDDEFSTYYYDSMQHSDMQDVELEEIPDPADDPSENGADEVPVQPNWAAWAENRLGEPERTGSAAATEPGLPPTA
jgi:TatA/E family protein of Tat protein translocase